jgi:hypothetical protein
MCKLRASNGHGGRTEILHRMWLYEHNQAGLENASGKEENKQCLLLKKGK